nr:PREDICTED: leucine-rich repeat-containing protein 66 [Balearica regulorum gibbericeps]
MDNLHLSVIAVVLYFNLPGSMGTKSQRILLDTHHHSDCRWDGEFSANCSFTGISTIPEDVSQTATTADFSYNNIKTFMHTDERNDKWMLKHLNLSNNLISELSLTAFRNLPVLETLNLNGNAIHTLTLDVPMPAHESKKQGKSCHLLPALKVLSVERNNLHAVPRGLGLLQSLQTVHLSSNGIRQINLDDFQNCSQLKDIDLQNNKITKIHPDAFRDLNKLQVMDLRENALTTPLPQVLISLNFFQLEVDLSNNGNGVSWWTPKGRISKDNHLPHMALDKMNNLVIYNADKTADGLYLCIFNTTKMKYLIYNIQVKEKVSTFLVRKARDTNTGFRQGRTEQDLALAVCLSVFITFVCAFCLGAFARPYLVSLWRLMRRNKNSGSEHTYSNQAFSDETLSRGCSASKPMQHNLFISDENSSRNTCIFPTETSTLHESVIDSSVRAPNTEEEYQKESNNEIYVKKKPAFSDIKTSINNYENINIDDNGLYSVRTDYKNSNEVTPRKLRSNDISLWEDSKYANNEDSEKSRFPPVPRRLNADSYSNYTDSSDLDLSFTEKTGFPFSTTQTHTVAQDSRNSQVSNNSGLLRSETTKAPPESPEREGIVSHNEPISITKFMPKRQSCDEQFGLNGNINITGDVGDFISPGSCKRSTNIENLSVYQTIENAPLRDYDCKTERTNEKYASADIFGDSSSDEGTPFTMSDCSSLADFELEQPGVSDNPPVCQSSVEEANTNSGTEKFSTLPESPNIAAELQHIGKHKDRNNGYFETTINYGSDTIMPETASPYTDKCSDHISMSDSDTISSSDQEVPDTFDYFTNEESTVQYSDSLHNQNTDFGNTLLSLKHSPTYNTDTESAPEEAELQLYQLAIEPQHPLRFSPTEQKENAPEGSTDEHNNRNSSKKNHGEGDITLRRNTSPPEDDDFIFAPIDTGLNEIVKKTSLLHSSNELSLQPLPENTTEKLLTFITEKEDLLPQGKQVKTAKARADQLQRDFNEKDCDGYTELQDTSNWSLPKEMQSCSAVADFLHLHWSGKTRSVFNTGDHFQLDQSDEDGHSFSVPQGFFNESTRQSSRSFPQKTTGNTISESIDSSEMEDDTTLTGLEKNFTTAGNLQNSSEKLSQKSQNNSGQGQFFVKKKRAFDGFANVLQSRRTNFSS